MAVSAANKIACSHVKIVLIPLALTVLMGTLK